MLCDLQPATMKAAFTFVLLATLAAAAPAQQAESLHLGKRLDGPLTIPLKHHAPDNSGNVVERRKLHLAARQPELFTEDELEELRKRSQGNTA